MRSLLSSIGFTFLAVIVAFLMYIFSPYAEEQRLRSQIPKELGINFNQDIELINNKNYGGLEEGGDMSLIRLGLYDCKVAYRAIANSKDRAKDRIYPNTDLDNFLTQNEIEISNPVTSYKIDKKGNTLFYALNGSQCILARDAYFE